MGRYKKLNRLERINFLSIAGAASLFTHLITERYKKEGIEIPDDVKCLMWFADSVVHLGSEYSALFFKIRNDVVYKPIKTNKYNNKRPKE